MEFDLDDFMCDVAAALRHHPSQASESSGKRRLPDNDATPERRPAPAYRKHSSHPKPSHSRSHSVPLSRINSEDGLQRELILTAPSHHSHEEPGGSDDDARAEDDSDLDNVLASFYPNVDMSTAILTASNGIVKSPRWDDWKTSPSEPRGPILSSLMSTNLMSVERVDLVPKFYKFTVNSCMLPIRKVQHELITLYFHHIHPMFPIVDEYHFSDLHRKFRGQEELMKPADFMIYHAIMVAAFAHLSEAQLQRTPYRSLHEGQEAQFDQVKARYWSQTTADPVVLTQVSLILSLWSPGNTSYQNNSYWLDMAFKHASAGTLWDTQVDEKSSSCRRRLLWWCCLIRDRVLAIGMRRPHRLHKAPFGRTIITEKDFGLEAKHPCYTDINSKRVAILAFIWFCKLSEIMAAVAVFQRRNKFARDWDGGKVDNTSSELEEVVAFDRELESWRESFEAAASEVIDGKDAHSVPVPISTLRIISHSLLAGLYQPYLHLSWLDHKSSVEDSINPLQRVKEGSRGVAASVADIMANKESDAIPVWLVAWVALPVAVYHVSQHVQIKSSPDRVLMPFLSRLSRRSTGGQLISLLMIKATKELVEEMSRVAQPINDPSSPDSPEVQTEGHICAASGMSEQETEARVLASVMEVLNTALELNGSSQRGDREDAEA